MCKVCNMCNGVEWEEGRGKAQYIQCRVYGKGWGGLKDTMMNDDDDGDKLLVN